MKNIPKLGMIRDVINFLQFFNMKGKKLLNVKRDFTGWLTWICEWVPYSATLCKNSLKQFQTVYYNYIYTWLSVKFFFALKNWDVIFNILMINVLLDVDSYRKHFNSDYKMPSHNNDLILPMGASASLYNHHHHNYYLSMYI